MLILGRRVGETLHIGDDIKIFVLHCDRTNVRIGIEAPSSVTILRGEIAQQPQAAHLEPMAHAAADSEAAAIKKP